jgi:large conductance mechanosensitive channel
MLKEFKAFALKGNVVDMAVGIIIGAAFGKIVSSLVSDIIMPPLGMLMGKVNFSHLTVIIQEKTMAHPAIEISYGKFLNTCLDFAIISFSIFIIVKYMHKLLHTQEKAKKTKPCPFCFSDINTKATHCPQCTMTVSN